MFSEPRVRLSASASARLVDETLSFPAGTLHMEVSAGLSVDGEALFEGQPTSGEYVNTDVATAIRTHDGTFAFIEAPFEVGEHRFVLNTELGSFGPR